MWSNVVVVIGGVGVKVVVVKMWYFVVVVSGGVVVEVWYSVVSPGGEGGIIYILIADRASTGR